MEEGIWSLLEQRVLDNFSVERGRDNEVFKSPVCGKSCPDVSSLLYLVNDWGIPNPGSVSDESGG